MKRFFFPALGGALLALCLAASALAEVVSYPPGTLQGLRYGTGGSYTNALAPTNSAGPVGVNAKSPSVNGGNATAPTNSVTLLAGGMPSWVLGAVNFLDTDAVSYNQAAITDGLVIADVYGGCHWLENGNTVATNNRATISGGTVLVTVYGGRAWSNAGGNASASGNTATINGGAMTAVRGGYAYSANGTATASNNTVDISDGSIFDHNATPPALATASVVGGHAVSTVGGVAVALNNTVKISAAPSTLDLALVSLYGGYASGGATLTSTGNTLQIAAAALGVEVRALYRFQKMDFTLPATLALGTPMVTVSYAVDFGTDAQISASAPGMTVNTGDTFTLIDATGAAIGGTVIPAPGSTFNGYNYTVEIVNSQLILTVGTQGQGPTPAATAIPTLGNIGLASLGLLLAGLAIATRRRGSA
ncbi:MAG: IPTL-CTERM sorting domain-containing protein [Burkholderiales bacterium]|nr:IPTL-CTERM sorting domain-containing protein [Burkholderiales bacterium]